ncbi:AAA family ATPase [Microbacterium elymi]|uniref:AAA family ATPase n=1 Tax=Microbacterium elymi TaxID=2909587 RepID=A0ABY5NIF2_9MICO|nr:AAA family ATPase [Microbacterium elymi]UUT34962.1 AAA family ATPase [Microbacterium elymi]
MTLLAEGHLLIEDVPGVGKTMLARALAATVDATVRRIQFTPDLLPGDVTGVSVFNPVDREFEFKPGAVFANIVIADEINRSSPKTQSALLEAMEEGQVTVDGHTHPLPDPFLVVATQNPLEMEGTYALPEAQRDRFMMRISMGYPDAVAEAQMLRERDTANPLAAISPVVDAHRVRELIAWARRVHVSAPIEQYAVALAHATRTHPDLRLGASPRATLQAGPRRQGLRGPGCPRVRDPRRHLGPARTGVRASPDPDPRHQRARPRRRRHRHHHSGAAHHHGAGAAGHRVVSRP